ncbi:hypothetical protein PLICRDRAFT_106916 [Plicaturopsis crispa FD-325 SS-3]|nr:hypothetical protein PLICRDRAFT_106916 [Plicaturopsis crispa FD-325 SS-3]
MPWGAEASFSPRSPSGTPQSTRVRDHAASQSRTFRERSQTQTPTDFHRFSERSDRMGRSERIAAALEILRGGRITPCDLLVEILDASNADMSYFRRGLFENDKFTTVLDAAMDLPEGKALLEKWMSVHSLPVILGTVAREMDCVTKALRLTVNDVTPAFLDSWSLESTVGKIGREKAPVTLQILRSASQTKYAQENNKIKKDPTTFCYEMLSNIGNHRSQVSMNVQAVQGLFVWATGCSRQMIDVLQKTGFCISYDSVLKLVNNLASCSIEEARAVAFGPHALCWDNINISTSIFTEQRANGPTKVRSGTVAVLYKLPNAKLSDMLLAPMLERAKKAPGLSFNADIRPTFEQSTAFNFQLLIHIIRILMQFTSGWESYEGIPELEHMVRRLLPLGYCTEQFPVRASTIEEASVEGNIAVPEDVYIAQLRMIYSNLGLYGIPTAPDQSTNARIRGAKLLRRKDVNPFTRMEVFQQAFGLFHLCLNLIWALLHMHRGSIKQLGSLTYFFALLDKARLGCEHPDYHTLLAALMQILNGLILSAWKEECGHASFASFSASKPTPEQLLEKAQNILNRFGTPMNEPQPPLTKPKAADAMDEDSDEPDSGLDAGADDLPQAEPGVAPGPQSEGPVPQDDNSHRNLRILTRDLLYVAELIRAISDGDIGRIEDILGSLAMMFRGAGSNNYCSEILHFLHNLKHVWTPEFANIMRDIMLVNTTGLAGHFLPIDLNIEHIIGFLKILFLAKGMYGSWERLGDISAAINHIQKVKRQVGSSLGAKYHGRTHTTPDTSASVWKVYNKVQELELHTFTPHRDGNDSTKPTVDILLAGEKKLKSSTLSTINKKIRSLVSGVSVEDEEDDIPAMGINVASNETVISE